MSDIAALRAALATAVGTISGLKAEQYWPDVMHFPVAIPMPASEDYLITFDDATDIEMFLVVLAGPAQAGGHVTAQKKLDGYLAMSGPSSIRAALEADPTLGGTVDNLAVAGWDQYHARWDANSVPAWGARCRVKLMR